MKIKTKKKSYAEVMALPREKHKRPLRQLAVVRKFLNLVSTVAMIPIPFTYEKIGMEKLGKKEPCLVLMNHSCFMDLEIAARLLSDRAYHVVCTLDGFVGKKFLLRLLGCISTKKFINDVTLVRDMRFAVRELKASVLMYPEASYSFDGTATPLPDSLGKCIKLLNVPVVVIQTDGLFLRTPLYNCLKNRKTKISAKMEYLLSVEDIQKMSVAEINQVVRSRFDFDHFKKQQEEKILIKEKYRAEGLHRVLYKCYQCHEEGYMLGMGTHITCQKCGQTHELTEDGFLRESTGNTLMSHIPDWYRWERECVRQELQDGTYLLDIDVMIYMMVNTKCVYQVGEGHLTHSLEGFHLTGCDGQLDFWQKPKASYGLYADYYWYEIGDMVCVGDEQVQYYCFPKNQENVVAKARLATEELFKMVTQNKVELRKN